MKNVLVLLCLLMPLATWAGCESSILSGSHTALSKKEAKNGAWEDAREVCYPGKANKISLACEKVAASEGVEGKKAVRCVQEIACNVCGNALRRKYEGLE